MLLWLIVALGFLACVAAWHLWQGITWEEAGTLFIAAAIVFAVHLNFIYDKATTDQYLVSGYVTSLIHRPPFSYQCGKHRCHESERWIIEQRPRQPRQRQDLTRRIHSGDGIEECHGECAVSYPAPYSEMSCCKGDAYAYSILVNPTKFRRTKLGDTSAVWKPYFNPVRVSDEVVYNDAVDIPYFKIDDYNRAHRIIPPQATAEEKLEEINAELSPHNISTGLILTQDNLYFETLKHAWHQGKANDFVIVVYAPGGQIRNVNVLGWNNYTLRENIAGAIMALPNPDMDLMLTAIQDTLRQGPDFTPMDFSRYHFLDVKIPEGYYWKIIIFQALFFAYMLMLLRLNPNTKDRKLAWSEVARMWEKHFHPPNPNWNLHPFAPCGLLLYIGVPFLAAKLLWL